jgi:hypothetical protein
MRTYDHKMLLSVEPFDPARELAEEWTKSEVRAQARHVLGRVPWSTGAIARPRFTEVSPRLG